VDPANTYSLVVEQAVQAATTALVAPQQVAAAAGQQAAALASLDEAQTAAFLAAARIQATDAMAAAPDLVTARVLGQGSDRAYEAAGQASAGQLITWVIIPLLATAALMAYERTSGTLRRLLVTPSRMATFLLGTLSGQLLMSLVQMALLIGFGVLVMGVNWGSSPAGLIVLLVSFGLAGVAMGTMLGTFTRTDRQAGNLSIMLGMVMALLGGCRWPMEFFPEGVQTAVKVLPTTWAMQGLTDITLRGQGLAGVWPEAAVLLGFAAVFFTLGVWRFRYE
jgi:ABC-2 type transport system permease protein